VFSSALLVLDEDVVLEDRRSEDGHPGPPLVQGRHLQGLLEGGGTKVDVLSIQNLRINQKQQLNNFLTILLWYFIAIRYKQ